MAYSEPLLPEYASGEQASTDLLPSLDQPIDQSHTYEDPASLDLQDAPLLDSSTQEARKPSAIYFDTEEQRLEYVRKQEEKAKAQQDALLKQYTDARTSAVDSFVEAEKKSLDSLSLAVEQPSQQEYLSNDGKVDLLNGNDKVDPVSELLNPPPSDSAVYAYRAARNKFKDKLSYDQDFNEKWEQPDKYKDYLAKRGIDFDKEPRKAYRATIDFVKDSLDYVSLAFPNMSKEQRDSYKEKLITLADSKFKQAAFNSSLTDVRGIVGPDGNPLATYSVKKKDGQFYAEVTKWHYDENGNPSIDPSNPTEKIPLSSRLFEAKSDSGLIGSAAGAAVAGISDFGSGLQGLASAALKMEETGKAPSFSQPNAELRPMNEVYSSIDEIVQAYAKQNMGLGEMKYAGDFKTGVLSGLANLSEGFGRALHKVDPFYYADKMFDPESAAREDAYFNDRSKLVAQGVQAMHDQYGSNKLNQSFSETALSGGLRVTGEMVPLIVEMFATRGMNTESLVLRLAQLSPIGLQSYSAEVGNRLLESDSYATLADSLRKQGKTVEADKAQSESDRLKNTADTAGFLTAMREMGTEMIFKEERLIYGGMKRTAGNFALSIPKNVTEDVASDILEYPQRLALGDKLPDRSLLETAGASAVAATVMGGAPMAVKAASSAYSNLNPSLDFGPSASEVAVATEMLKMQKEGTVATPMTADSFVAEQRDHTYETPQDQAKFVTDDSGTRYVRTDKGFQSPSGNIIPVYSEGKGAVLQAKYDAAFPQTEEEKPSAIEVTPVEAAQPKTLDEAITSAIKTEFPLYQEDNKAGEKSLKKILSPLSYVWNGLQDSGYSIKLEKNRGEGQKASGGVYVDNDTKQIVVNIADLNASKGIRSKGWSAAALNEEINHITIAAAGVDTASLAATAPSEVIDAVSAIYGRPMQGAELGDELLRMFVQGKITKNEDGSWKIGGKSITETQFKNFEGKARYALSQLFTTYAGYETQASQDGNANSFAKLLVESADKVAETYEKTFGETIYSPRIRKELTSGDFSYDARRFLYNLASKASDFVGFATDVIDKMFTSTQQESAELSRQDLDSIAHTYDAYQADQESKPAGLLGSMSAKASAIAEALKQNASIASREILIKMGSILGSAADLVKWTAKAIGRALTAAEKLIVTATHQVASFVKQLLPAGKDAEETQESSTRRIWNHIKQNQAVYAAMISAVNGFSGFNAEAFNNLYKELNVGSFEQFKNVVAFINRAYSQSKRFADRTRLNDTVSKASPDVQLFDESIDFDSLSEGDIVFAVSPIPAKDMVKLKEKGVSVISPNLSPINTGEMSLKEWEQSVLGDNKIQTISLAQTVNDLFEKTGNKQGVALMARAARIASAIDIADKAGRDTTNLAKEHKAVIDEINKLTLTGEFQSALTDELSSKLGVDPHQVFLKPANSANSEGIQDLNREGEKIQFQYKGKEVIAQKWMDFDPKRSFRIHAVNDSGKWYIVPASTFSRDVDFDEQGKGKNYNYLPIIAGEYLQDAADAEQSALDMLSQIQSEELNDRLLSLDVEFDKNTGRYYIVEFNPSREKGGGGYIANFFVMDGLVSMFTGKAPEFIKLAQVAAEESHTYEDSNRMSSPGQRDARFNELVASLPDVITEEDIVRFKHAHSKEYAELETMRGTALSKVGYTIPLFTAQKSGSLNNFDFKRVGENEGMAALGPGVYLLDNKGMTKNAYGERGSINSVLLNRNAFIIDIFSRDQKHWAEVTGRLDKAAQELGFENYKAISQHGVSSLRDGRGPVGAFVKLLGREEARNLLVKHGIHGSKELLPNGSYEYAIYDPTQLKSAEPLSPGPKIPPSQWGLESNPDIRYSSAGNQQNDPYSKRKVVFNNNRSKAQRAAIASHTYEKNPTLKALLSKINYKFLSPSDKQAFDSFLENNNNATDKDAVKEFLSGIKSRSDKNWFTAIQARFPEILAGKDFNTIFNSNIEAVRAQVRHSFTFESPDNNQKPDSDKNFQSASQKRRDELASKVDEARKSVWEYIIPKNGDQMESWTELDAKHKAQIANGLKLLQQLDLSQMTNKELARAHAILQAIITDGDFFGFHDLMSKFRAMGVASMVANIVKKGDPFNDRALSLNRPVSKMQARIDSVFRFGVAKGLWDAIYGTGTVEAPAYMANIEAYHARLTRANARISQFFKSNKTSIDARLGAGIVAILTQYNPLSDETAEFNKRLQEVNSSIKAMAESDSASLRATAQIAQDILDLMMSGLPPVIIDGPSARAQVEANLASNPRGMFTNAYDALEFARAEFAASKSEAKYIKSVVFGEQFQDFENYVHLLARNAQSKPGQKGNETKSLGTQENALKDRQGLAPGGTYYYDLDIGTMLFDGVSDHMYEYETAYNRLMLSHLHNYANEPLVNSYRGLFAKNPSKSNSRWSEVTEILQGIHHGITSAAFAFNGTLGSLVDGFHYTTTLVNSLKLINPLNIPSQFISGMVGLESHLLTGRVSHRGLGMALALIAAPNNGADGIFELIQDMAPNLNMRAKNVDAQFDYQKHASKDNLPKYSKMHRKVRDKLIANLKKAAAGVSEFALDEAFNRLVRWTNGYPDRAIAAISFLSSYFDSYEKRSGSKISSLNDFRNALENVDFGAVHAAQRVTDKIMGNPSNPEVRASTFQAKTTGSMIAKNALFMFRQTTMSLAATGANGIKAALFPGGTMSKQDIAIRLAGLSDFLSSALQAVIFPFIKKALGPYLIWKVLYEALSKDDKELTEEQLAAKRDLINLHLQVEKNKVRIDAMNAIKMVAGGSNMNYTNSRNQAISLIQSVVPVLNNEIGDFAMKIASDKISASKVDEYWQIERARNIAQLAQYEAESARNKSKGVSDSPELKRNIMAHRIMIELTKIELSNEGKLFFRGSSYGGTFSSFMEVMTGIAEFDSDEPAMKEIRRSFEKAMPMLAPYARIEKRVEGKGEAKEKRQADKVKKAGLTRKALGYGY